MATGNDDGMRTAIANADLSGYIHTVMYQTTTARQVGLAVNPGTRAERPAGILYNKPSAAGQGALLKVSGLAQVIGGAAITVGDQLTFNGSGRVITISSGGQYNVGQALTAISNDGEELTVELIAPTMVSSY